MLRVQSNNDMKTYTEFEEDILFDQDDPDFTSSSVPSIQVFRVPTTMSLASVHPAELHSRHGSLTTLSHSVDDITGWTPQENVMTIEELRMQMTSCFTCGVSWAEKHVSLDCSECGGYAMERPCPTCDGTCGSIWKRDLTMSHASSKARWNGKCGQFGSRSKLDTAKSTNPVAPLPQELCSKLEKLNANS